MNVTPELKELLAHILKADLELTRRVDAFAGDDTDLYEKLHVDLLPIVLDALNVTDEGWREGAAEKWSELWLNESAGSPDAAIARFVEWVAGELGEPLP